MSNTVKNPLVAHCKGKILAVVLASIMFIYPIKHSIAQSQASQQTYFETPELAAKALITGLENDDNDAMLKIFGPELESVILQKDRAGLSESRKRAYLATQEMLTWRENNANSLTLIIGNKAWPMPIPLVKEAGGWRFDSAAGVDELINRRIGRNELSAIEISRVYVDAQKQYASRDRDGDDVLEYAQLIKSTEGNQDGLYWEDENDEISPFGPLVADAKDYFEGRKPGDPFKGYYFKILTSQGENVPGGKYNYVINGNMIAGFAMVAFPADYGISGIMTFMVSHHGKLYQKDLGPNTLSIAKGMSEYNPDQTWTKVSE